MRQLDACLLRDVSCDGCRVSPVDVLDIVGRDGTVALCARCLRQALGLLTADDAEVPHA